MLVNFVMHKQDSIILPATNHHANMKDSGVIRKFSAEMFLLVYWNRLTDARSHKQ